MGIVHNILIMQRYLWFCTRTMDIVTPIAPSQNQSSNQTTFINSYTLQMNRLSRRFFRRDEN